MATIEGLTAAKALELAALDIVDGEVVGDELWLTTRGGDVINAGNVRGVPGTDGADAAVGDVSPTAGTTPIRASSGRVKGGTATAVDDLTTKAQVDALITALITAYGVADTAAIAAAASAAAGLYQPLVTAMPAPVAITTSSASSSSTTEARDAVLGNYTFTSIAGHYYKACLDQAAIVADTLNDQFAVRIRDGGGSTPTSSSTMLASARAPVHRASIAIPVQPGGVFAPSAGTHTLAAFLVRLAGSGTAVIWSADIARQLYVIDLGR